MIRPTRPFPSLTPEVCHRALDARDARFDGLFFVGIVTTGVYCRPTCPSRKAHPDNRRFFNSAASAECAGFRPCLRCRPELSPGRAPIEAMSRLAYTVTQRIAAGALNGQTVADLAADLGVSERHVRRALQREIGLSPVELAQTHRLLLAKRLLADTTLSVTQVAFASGFQSVRRFNVAFHDRYRMSPSTLRRPLRPTNGGQGKTPGRDDDAVAPADFLRITLAYRPPLAWDALTTFLRRRATPGVEIVRGQSYGRTVCLGGRNGAVLVRNVSRENQLQVDLSPALLPVLMPLLPRLRQLFDLDAEPLVVDAHLERSGLAYLVDRHRGVRIPGALDGFEIALLALLRGAEPTRAATRALAGRVAAKLGQPLETGIPGLTRLMPSAETITDAARASLTDVGVPRRRAAIILSVARAVSDGTLRLEPGSDVMKTRRALMEIEGMGEGRATMIVMRALYWPDAFPSSDRALQLAAGASSPDRLRARAERWRPWRAYAALHLWLRHDADVAAHRLY